MGSHIVKPKIFEQKKKKLEESGNVEKVDARVGANLQGDNRPMALTGHRIVVGAELSEAADMRRGVGREQDRVTYLA